MWDWPHRTISSPIHFAANDRLVLVTELNAITYRNHILFFLLPLDTQADSDLAHLNSAGINVAVQASPFDFSSSRHKPRKWNGWIIWKTDVHGAGLTDPPTPKHRGASSLALPHQSWFAFFAVVVLTRVRQSPECSVCLQFPNG